MPQIIELPSHTITAARHLDTTIDWAPLLVAATQANEQAVITAAARLRDRRKQPWWRTRIPAIGIQAVEVHPVQYLITANSTSDVTLWRRPPHTGARPPGPSELQKMATLHLDKRLDPHDAIAALQAQADELAAIANRPLAEHIAAHGPFPGTSTLLDRAHTLNLQRPA